MSRSLLPAVMILATITALVLAAAAVVLQPEAGIPLNETARASDTDLASRAVVERFYAAVNHGIATGNVELLDAVLALDYVEGDTSATTVPGRDRLEATVREIHETVPTLRLAAESIVTEDARVVATVRTAGVETARFLGLRLIAPRLWGPTDDFYLYYDRVQERLTGGSDRVTLESLVRIPISLEPATGRMVSAIRVVLPPGGERTGVYLGDARLLYVVAGALALTIADRSGVQDQDAPPEAPADPDVISAGESILQADGSAYTARNDGDEPAALLEISAAPVPFQSAIAGQAPRLDNVGQEVQSQVVSPDSGVEIAAGAAAFSIGRAILEPGGQLVWEGARGPVMLLIPAGTVGLRTSGQPVWTRRSGDSIRAGHDRGVLASGDGALLLQDTAATLLNPSDERVTVLIVTLLGETDADGSSTPERLGAVAVLDTPERVAPAQPSIT